jgi:CspA family cold shock protein
LTFYICYAIILSIKLGVCSDASRAALYAKKLFGELLNNLLASWNLSVKSTQEMQKGTITSLVADRGFGFITVEGMEKDLFFHTTQLRDVQFEELKQGDTLVFDVEEGDKGPSAVNVTLEGAGNDAPVEESTDEEEA